MSAAKPYTMDDMKMWCEDELTDAARVRTTVEALAAMTAERDAALDALRNLGSHSMHCYSYKTIGRFGSRSGLRWSAGDEKMCDCALGAALERHS